MIGLASRSRLSLPHCLFCVWTACLAFTRWETAGAVEKGNPLPGQPGGPAAEAFARWRGQQSGDLAPGQLATGLQLAQARAREMRVLMEKDPRAFERQAMPSAERARLPRDLQSLVERRVKGRGSFGVYCALPGAHDPASEPDHGHRHGLAYEVRLDGVMYRAFVAGRWQEQRTVREATIEGVVLGDAMALGDAPTPEEQAAAGGEVIADAPSLSGPNTVLYLVARFSDETNAPIDDTTALNQMGVLNTFWLNNSGGTVSIRGLVNAGQVMDVVHIVLPQPMSYGSTYNSNLGQLLSDARAAAAAAGYNSANYNLDVVVTSNQGFSYAGRAYISGQGAHLVKPYTSLRTAGHELGHNLGLYHANYWRTDATRPFGKDSIPSGYVADSTGAEWVEYGHYFSVMSAQYSGEMDDPAKPHYAPAEKVRLGWLSGSAVRYVAGSGTNRLFRLDHRDTVGTPRGIRIETPATDYTGSGRYYWLSYRYAPWSTAQNWFRSGLQVDVARSGYGSDGAVMLDLTPYSKDAATPFYDPNNRPGSYWTIDNNDKLDGALVVGRTFSDPEAGIHITPLGTGQNGTNEEYIDVVVQLGAFPGNRPPVITAFSATTNQATVNQAVNFSVTASDPDGDPLAYVWDFDQVQTWTASGLNSPTAAKSWSSAGQYRVTVTVSDMKGGRVGEPPRDGGHSDQRPADLGARGVGRTARVRCACLDDERGHGVSGLDGRGRDLRADGSALDQRLRRALCPFRTDLHQPVFQPGLGACR